MWIVLKTNRDIIVEYSKYIPNTRIGNVSIICKVLFSDIYWGKGIPQKTEQNLQQSRWMNSFDLTNKKKSVLFQVWTICLLKR